MSIPSFLIDKLNTQYGEKVSSCIIDGMQKKKVCVRVNTLKTSIDFVCKFFSDNNISFSTVPWFDSALIVDNVDESVIRNFDLYNNGFIYLQNLSSMIPPIIMDLASGFDVLDMCAAPGGKTCELACLCPDLNITAYELNKVRFDRLVFNLNKQGVSCVSAFNKDARNINNLFKFDSILLDAPCSGSGTLCADENNNNFTELLINKCIKNQKILLDKAFKLLKPGSTMVYSTCSILKDENENILNYFLNKYNCEIIPIKNNFFDFIPTLNTVIDGTFCVMPTNLFEGFFVAKIKKN